jgi:plastocyanin
MTVRQFLPDSLTIKRGDSVVWYTDTRVPVHTVSFPVQAGGPIGRWVPHLADGGFLPLELLAPSGVYRGAPDSLDWPRVVQDVDELRPARPSAVYDPTKYYNSSRLGDPTETQSRAWSLSFNVAGSYQYFCWPHVNVGMIGTITVTS